MSEKNENRENNRRFPVWAIVLCVILSIIIIAGTAVCIFVGSKLSKINKYDPDAIETIPPEDESFETDPYKDGTEIIEPGDIEWADDINTASKDGVTNILLIGQDTRNEGNAGRSDSMMVLTIDKTNL